MEHKTRRAEIARNCARNALRPIYKLPDEALSEIFLLSASPMDGSPWGLPFLATCHHWRKCAIRCPRLWNIISIRHCTELALCLSRSASDPLHIRFQYQKDDGSPETIMAHFTAAYQTISSHNPRIHSLRVTGVPSIATVVPLGFPTNTLRELCLQWSSAEHPASPLPIVDCDGSRNIRSLDLRGPTRNTVHLRNLQLESLTALTVNQAVTVGSVCEVLMSCHSLVDLRWLYVGDLSAPLEWAMVSFSMPKLEGLCMSGVVSVPFMKACDMPRLESLSITNPASPMQDVVTHLIRFKTITQIELYSVPLPRDEVFVSVFQNMEKLTYFSCDTWTPSNLKSLRILNEHACHYIDGKRQLNCPLLESLIIDGVRLAWNQEPELVEKTLRRHLEPLLQIRNAGYQRSLCVYLPNIDELDGLVDTDGIRFGVDYPLIWD